VTAYIYLGRINCVCLYYHWLIRKPGKRIKEKVVCFAVPQTKAQLQDYHRLHPAFTMMLSKPLVSFIAAFAAATGVSAAAAPMARGGGYPTPISASQCNVGSISCCNTVTSSSDPFAGLLSGLLGIPLDLGALVGLSCLDLPLTATQCVGSPVCCTNFSQSGLINVGCTPVILGL